MWTWGWRGCDDVRTYPQPQPRPPGGGYHRAALDIDYPRPLLAISRSPRLRGRKANPGGRPSVPEAIKAALSELSPRAVQRLGELLDSEDQRIRLEAAKATPLRMSNGGLDGGLSKRAHFTPLFQPVFAR